MTAILNAPRGELPPDADAAVRQLYSHHAGALHGYVRQFCPDRASADDIVQETFIRAWRHLPQLSAGDRPIRPWLFRVARNLLTDADRAARSRPVTVQAEPDDDARDDTGLQQGLDRQLVAGALQRLSPPHRGRGCQRGRGWSAWAALVVGAASPAHAAASGFLPPYAIPDSATAALGVLLTVTVLAPAGQARQPEQLTENPCIDLGSTRSPAARPARTSPQ